MPINHDESGCYKRESGKWIRHGESGDAIPCTVTRETFWTRIGMQNISCVAA